MTLKFYEYLKYIYGKHLTFRLLRKNTVTTNTDKPKE